MRLLDELLSNRHPGISPDPMPESHGRISQALIAGELIGIPFHAGCATRLTPHPPRQLAGRWRGPPAAGLQGGGRAASLDRAPVPRAARALAPREGGRGGWVGGGRGRAALRRRSQLGGRGGARWLGGGRRGGTPLRGPGPLGGGPWRPRRWGGV